jgi:hypothetical protein
MTREEAARIYLDGLITKSVKIEKFIEAARVLSADDKSSLQMAVEEYRIAWKGLTDKMESNSV